MADRLTSLPAIEAAVWQQLALAPTDKQHAWRDSVLATVDDGMADARTVILREVDAGQKQLVIFSDDRAAKVRQLRLNPRATLVMWSPTLSWQLRCRVRLSIENSGLAVSSRWERLKLSPAAQDYLSPLPPGTPLDATPAAQFERACFAVITASVESIDWLELHREGHRRALFSGAAAQWLQP